jgi:hypothetical protein
VDGWDGSGRIHFVRAVFDDYFVYEVASDQGSALYRLDYTTGQQGQIQVSGDPVRVREETEFVAVDEMTANVRSQARRPEYEGTESDVDWSATQKDLEAYVAGYYDANPDAEEPEGGFPDTVDALPAAAKNWIAAKSLLGDSNASTFEELLFFPVVNPNTNQLNENALDAVLSGRGAQADIPEQALNSARNMARNLLEEEFGRELENNESKANEAETNNTFEKEDDMPVSNKIKEKVSGLISNGATQFTEDHREWLESLSECKLNALEPVANEKDEEKAPKEQPKEEPTANKEEGDTITLSSDKFQALVDAAVEKRLERDERESLISALENEETGMEREDFEGMSTKALKNFAKAFGSKADYSGRGYAAPSVNKADTEDEAPEMPPVVMAQAESPKKQ